MQKIFKTWACRSVVTITAFSFIVSPLPVSAEQTDPLINDFLYRVANGVSKSRVAGFSGAFTHSIPIVTPPGRNGLEPHLELTYSNQSREDLNIFGYGWDVQIPYIQRLNKRGENFFYTSTTTTYFSSSMSGELATTSDDTIFVPQTDDGSYMEYEFASSTNQWTVTDKNGLIYKFGHASTTRQDDPDDEDRVYKWMLEEVRDPNDNYITYEYYKDSGFIYPSLITYTGHGSTDGIFTVEFNREARTDQATSTAAGFEAKAQYRVNEIVISVDGTWVRKYELSYTTGENGGRSLLDTVTESGQAYDTGSSVISYFPASNFDYTQTASFGWATTTDTFALPEEFRNTYVDTGVRVADVNGDALPDIIRAQIGTSTKVYLNTGEAWELDETWSAVVPEYFTDADGADLGVRLADINGDGLADFLRADDSVTRTHLNTGTGWATSTDFQVPYSFLQGNQRLADVNGDGLIDALFSRWNIDTSSQIAGVYLNRGSDFVYVAWPIPIAFTKTLVGITISLGVAIEDVNGDGLADLITSDSDQMPGASAGVYLNNGSGWTKANSWTAPHSMGSSGNDQGQRLIDVNSDGLVDWVDGTVHNGVYINNGQNWVYDASWTTPTLFLGSNGYSALIADVDGDGMTDIVQRNDTVHNRWINQGQPTDLINHIEESSGRTIDITYKSSATYNDNISGGMAFLNSSESYKSFAEGVRDFFSKLWLPHEKEEAKKETGDLSFSILSFFSAKTVKAAEVKPGTSVASSTDAVSQSLVDNSDVLLKAQKANLLGAKESTNGEVTYAYKSNQKVDTAAVSAEVSKQASENDLSIVAEDVGKRTNYARTFTTNIENTFVTEIIGDAPQYYQDTDGEWYYVEYATTSQEIYDRETKPEPEKQSLLKKIFNLITWVPKYVYAQTVDTFYPDPDTESSSVDGTVGYDIGGGSGVSWSTLRNSTGTDAADANSTFLLARIETKSGAWSSMYRGAALFDTSSIPDGSVISSATLSVYGHAKNNPGLSLDVNVYTVSPSSNTSLVAADYNTYGTTELSDTISYSSFSTSGYNDFALNSTGIAQISLTGVSKFGFRNASYDAADSEPTTPSGNTDSNVLVKSAETAGTSQDPKLVVVYTAAPLGDLTNNPNLPFVVQTVKSVVYNDGLGTISTTTYAYEGGDYYYNNAFDRSFSGFGVVEKTDPTGNVMKTYYHQANDTASTTGEYEDSRSKIGKMYRVESYDNAENLYDLQINTWIDSDREGEADFVALAKTVTLGFDGDSDHRDIAESFTYSTTTGNLTQKISWGEVTATTTGSFTDTGSDLRTTAFTYAASSTGYLIVPSQETVTDQSATKIRETKNYYDDLAHGSVATGNLTKQESWVSGSTYVDVEKSYNSYGLVTQETDPRGNITTHAYDGFSLYPATTTNPLSQVVERLYDYSSGKVRQLTDANGRVFQTLYDPFDRVKEEKQPDLDSPSSLVTKTAYTYTDVGIPRSVYKVDYLTSTTSIDSYVFTDGSNRKVQEKTEAEDSNYFTKDFTYDERGLLEAESLPYYSTGTTYTATSSPVASTLLTSYAYDPLQRVLTSHNVIGTTTNAYDQWIVTTTDVAGNDKDVEKDAYGNIAEVVEHNGGSSYTTAYEYDGNNKLTKITDAASNVRNFTYDGLGRRLTAEDLHDSGDGTYGTWTYVYDAASNLATTTDPKSQEIEYTYDALNRVLTEDYAGSGGTEVEYAYDSCTEGEGHLCFATSTDAVTAYNYNALGLTEEEIRTIDGVDYTTTHFYDRLGNPTKIIHPDSSQVSYSYNSAGLQESMAYSEDGGSFGDVVTDFDYAPTGKVSYKVFANGVTSTYTYDEDELYRLSRILTETGGGEMALLGDFGSSLAALFDGTFFAAILGEQTVAEDVAAEDAVEESVDTEGEVLGEEVSESTPEPSEEVPESVSDTQEEVSESKIIGGTTLEDVASSTPEVVETEDEIASTTEAVVTGETSGGGGGDSTEEDVSTTTPEVVPEEEVVIEPELPVATTTPEAPVERAVDAPDLLFKAPLEKHLGSKEYADGTVEYAYRSDVKVDDVPVSSEVLVEAEKAELTVGEEVVEERTKYSRTYSTNKDDVFVTEFISGVPQYYKDDEGEWWIAEYATTTRESYEYQKGLVEQSRETSFLQKALSFLGRFIGYNPEKAYADTSTFYPDPDTETSSVDGSVGYDVGGGSGVSWSTIRNSTGTDAADSISTFLAARLETKSGAWSSMYRGIVVFDTSSLPDNHVVSSATLSLYGHAKNNPGVTLDTNVYTANPSSNTSLTGSDYNTLGTTALSTTISFASFTTSGYNDFALNSTGIAQISVTGVTKLGLRNASYDAADSEPSAPGGNTDNNLLVKSAETSGTSQDPKLVVIHQAAPDLPTALLTEGQTNPNDVSDNTPEFSALYEDEEEDPAVSYQIQVATSSSFTYTYWDSTKTTLASSTASGARIADISYGGSGLASTTVYYWRIKFWDDNDAEGPWSTETATFMLASNDTIQDILFEYDDVGNIVRITDVSGTAAQKTVVYDYDDLYRLTSASTTEALSNAYKHSFTYSSIGNMTGMATSTATTTYTYAETGYANPHAPTTIGTDSLVYDNNGNLTSETGTGYTWDYRNRMVATGSGAATTTYGYDHTEQRVFKNSNNATTTYVNRLYDTDGTTNTKSLYNASGELVATVKASGGNATTTYIHADHLGGTNAVTDENGSVVQALDYYPYGSERISSGDNSTDKHYIGERYDDETELSYLNARYYEGARGQFLSQDPVFWEVGQTKDGQGIILDPQLQNSYSYASNNPIISKDPTGEIFQLLAIPATPILLEWIGAGFLTATFVKTVEGFYENVYLPEAYPAAFSPEERTEARIGYGFTLALDFSTFGIAKQATEITIDGVLLATDYVPFEPNPSTPLKSPVQRTSDYLKTIQDSTQTQGSKTSNFSNSDQQIDLNKFLDALKEVYKPPVQED